MAGVLAAVVLATVACSGDDDEGNLSPTMEPTPSSTGIPNPPVSQLELPVQVAVTLPMFADFVERIGGDNVEVISLVPPGEDPHSYRLTEEDIARLAGVDFFFVNGGGLDPALAEAIEANRDESAYVIPFAPNIRSPQDSNLYAEEAGDNPHLWLDPDLADVYPETVADTFVIYDGINEAFYNPNWQAMREEFRAFEDEARTQIAAIPEANRTLFTYHDSFPHFARAVGLAIGGFATPAPGGEVSPDDISALASTVQQSGVPAVFAEYGYDAAAMEAVATQAGVQLCTLYSDIMPEGVTTYLDMMRANVDEIVRCLGTS